MPELPEVEYQVRWLERLAGGQVLDRLEILDARLGDVCADRVEGELLSRVERRGKYLVLYLGEHRLVLHLRMTGKLLQQAESGVRARLWFGGVSPVDFVDTRRLGTMEIRRGDLAAFFEARKIGPEPWPKPRPGPWWRERLSGVRSPVKTALMRQDRVAGLGNIAASEICWRAGLPPERPASDLATQCWERLGAAALAHIEMALEDLEQSPLRYLAEGGGNPFYVYGREGEYCRRCNAVILRSRQAGRVTFYCSGCQASR